ncbi:DUF6244 family protein [Micromonospora sp. WMMD882]|uniref:DUF6244 family protein n=1 Tax=Micromonospora sp. WMMD882 TaxID=3015151 RepID=UPI00248C85C8|nr:DUF6244 family protein [Micromonospora sp. WMMD882]WBB79302.1 DUF6244 family protein [Micromonospora sp. WMMD882]
MSAAEIIARLSEAGQSLQQAQAQVTAAVQNAENARILVAGALDGAASDKLIATIDAAREQIGQAIGSVGPAQQGIQETIAKVRALGN